MVFLVDPDELRRAMNEIAAQQSANIGSGGSPPSPPDSGTGQQSAPPQSSAPTSPQPSAAVANNYSQLNPYAGIDYSVIARHEAPKLSPYWPKGSDNSGITVATGVDLSEHTPQELRDWGVSEDTIAKLAPFLKLPDGRVPGLKGQAASDRLDGFNQDNPSSGNLPRFEIPMADAQAMDTGALRSITGYVQHYYDAANPTIPFAQLPDAVRTAIVDAAYQNGPDLAASAPRFWQAITAGDWFGAADEMHNWTGAQKADPDATRTPRQLDDEKLFRNGFNPAANKR